MGKNLFTQETGKFLVNDPKEIRKNAMINAKSTVPHLEVGGQSRPLSNKCFSIGRDKTNQIVVADPKASRFHAVITFENNSVYLKDTDSSNGTFVNDIRIASNKKVKLKNGDRIKVGTTVLTLKQ